MFRRFQSGYLYRAGGVWPQWHTSGQPSLLLSVRDTNKHYGMAQKTTETILKLHDMLSIKVTAKFKTVQQGLSHWSTQIFTLTRSSLNLFVWGEIPCDLPRWGHVVGSPPQPSGSLPAPGIEEEHPHHLSNTTCWSNRIIACPQHKPSLQGATWSIQPCWLD